ncbi:methyltransferase domain-containing protein [Phytoactinopolyspora alkaliphila]|nr:methyltransferase domain-containing protein [Phytoactinopolyspora alkaliphila]
MADADTAALDARLGYSKVDQQPDVATVLAGMDATAAWPSVRRLRAWERARLAPRPGDEVLDVGCGLGDVAATLAANVAPGGRVVGIDASTSMLEVARSRVADAGVSVDFHTGDAADLGEPDAAFDICRSERTLQWLEEPGRAVNEMVRVLRPGGRLCITDTDWLTLTIDIPDDDAVAAFREAIPRLRGTPASAGSKLLNLCRDAGITGLEATAETHVWTQWSPDTEATPSGVFPIPPIVHQMVEARALDAATGSRFLEQLVHAGRTGRVFMSVGMFAVAGRRPG